MPTRFFRAGVGTVIYSQDGKVAFFKRKMHPAGIWQFQQGGIDVGEHPEKTLWRELEEEVGLKDVDIEKCEEMPGWTIYQDLHTEENTDENRIGQAHKWYFLKLHVTKSIDLSEATEDEFDDWKWVTFKEAIAATSDHKKHVYERLQAFFVQNIQAQKNQS